MKLGVIFLDELGLVRLLYTSAVVDLTDVSEDL